MFTSCSIFWTLILLAAAVVSHTLSSNRVVISEADLMKFENLNSSDYSNLLVKNGWLYATGVSHVFRLYASRIDDSAKNSFNYINTTAKLESGSKRNFITFLGSRDKFNDLVICGTNLGKPHIYDLNEADLSYQFEHDGIYLCPGVESFASLGLINYQNQAADKKQTIGHGVMYSGIWITSEPSQKYSDFSRYGIFRKNMEVNDQFARTLFSPRWLWVNLPGLTTHSPFSFEADHSAYLGSFAFIPGAQVCLYNGR